MGGDGEILDKNPLDFYSTGILFPQVNMSEDYDDPNPDDSQTQSDEEVSTDGEAAVLEESDQVRRKRKNLEADESDEAGELELTTRFRPSAAGLSVLTPKDALITLTVSFAVYKKKAFKKSADSKDGLTDSSKKREQSRYEHLPYMFSFTGRGGQLDFGNLNYKVNGNIITVELSDSAKLSIATRFYPQSESLEIKTFTLINKQSAGSFSRQKKAETCLFQPLLSLFVPDGLQPFEDRTDLTMLSAEDINLKLLYRHYNTYALGHGLSVNWERTGAVVSRAFTEVMPSEKVNGVDLSPDTFKGSNVLYIKRLSGNAVDSSYQWDVIYTELKKFSELYGEWIQKQDDAIGLNSERLRTELLVQARKNLEQCRKLQARMNRGVVLLAENGDALKAFEDANRAMFMQRVLADFSRHRRLKNRVQHHDDAYDDYLPDYSLVPFDAVSGRIWHEGQLSAGSGEADENRALARWRPFQLAFLLSQIEGIIDPSSEDRDTVDLIWFPTGGGKTEAYLGLTAFTIFYRRLNARKLNGDPDTGAGVSVLMRYTLRLLNKQQFERASILICCCDLVRRTRSTDYGNSRISNGIWMGRTMTPNTEEVQQKDYGKYISRIDGGNAADTFGNTPPLLSCPCCGNRLVPETIDKKLTGRWGYFRARNNRNIEKGRYLIGCTNTKCDFHVTADTLNQNRDRLLPIYEVDETIYSERPSLLFSTVDKFVQLAWKPDCFKLFNIEFRDGRTHRLFPSPELIIQDELHLISSSLGTIYGIYEIVVDRLCREEGGNFSKIVGATATVRNAEVQCRRLYGRKNFLQFPPPAIDADDSFYALKIKENDPKNRLYVGFMPSGITTSTALIRLASVLLERIPAFPLPNEEVDRYYTLIVYFNALRELGKFRTFLADDIVAYRKLLSNHFNTFVKPFNNSQLCELSSVMTADDITTGLDRLEKTTLPVGLNHDNILIKKLFESGIRTRSDLKTAKGGNVWSLFLNKSFFDQIELSFTGDQKKDYRSFITLAESLMSGQQEPVHVAPATNMISVGVDIPRLNTMIINGQPKTTAEYIQASSRVGRDGPGIVFAFLAPTRNRDRSHYEQFKAFHQSYYYYVESSSVTPFSGPAIEKVLPTVLIALTRSLYLHGNADVFSPDSAEYTEFIEHITDEIVKRGKAIYGDEYGDEISVLVNTVRRDFLEKLQGLNGDRRLAEYNDYMERDSASGRMISVIKNPLAVYNAPSQFVESILQDHVATMQTLRNVESTSRISIKSA